MYAIIESGGKQYKVSAGDVIRVEKLNAQSGDGCAFTNVLALFGDEREPVFGAPYVDGASVSATVLRQDRDKKVIVYKYKSKKTFHKKKGHRQPFTELRIDAVNA
jgi:large subunit ribosomal protein L21